MVRSCCVRTQVVPGGLLWALLVIIPAQAFHFSVSGQLGVIRPVTDLGSQRPHLSPFRRTQLHTPLLRTAATAKARSYGEELSTVADRLQGSEQPALVTKQATLARKVGSSRFVKSLYKLAVLSFTCLLFNSAALAASTTTEAASGGILSGLKRALHFVLHLDTEMQQIVAKYGTTTYSILWGIVFAETGLVVTPFLPGDSLLFACGALCGLGALNIWITIPVFLTAAVIGDAVNYAIGNRVGTKAFESDTWFLKRKNLRKTEEFYDKYGGKTIVLARFVPIVRTFAPFVAGVGSMRYKDFAFYNVIGAVLWVLSFLGAGFFFGNLPAVKHNFTLVVLAIVVVSVIPVALEVWEGMKEGKAEQTKVDEAKKGSDSGQ